MAKRAPEPKNGTMRIGEAAELLGVSADTLRRWETSGRIRLRRSAGGQRLISLAEVRRVQRERRPARDRPIVAQSARNRFPGFVTRVERDRVAAVVEVQAGPHRLVSLMTAAIIGATLATYLVMSQNQHVSIFRSQVWNSSMAVTEG